MRSHSKASVISQDSVFSADCEEFKEENNPQQKRVPDAEVTAELVFVRLSVMAVAIKYSHLGVTKNYLIWKSFSVGIECRKKYKNLMTFETRFLLFQARYMHAWVH